MPLRDLLACPVCKSDVDGVWGDQLACQRCGRRYPFVNGVPCMLADPPELPVSNERELDVRPGYSRWKERIVLKSLTDAHVALDFGAGRQALDDPCIIRMDITPSPYVDLVGDVQALPLKAGSVDFAFGGAVMEHLRKPDRAVQELYDVLKPGGYVYADWNFIIGYHGYPHHYFNATLHGIREAFRSFTEIESGVAPFQGPAFAIRSVLGTYLEYFHPKTLIEHELALQLHRVCWYPLDDFEKRFKPEDRFRIACGVYVFGVKQPTGTESLIPDVIMDVYKRSPDLQTRFPQPLNLAIPDNLMIWAKSEGAVAHASIRQWLVSLPTFSKYADPARRFDRSTVSAWPLELMDQADELPGADVRLQSLWFGRPLTIRIREGWARSGILGAVRAVLVAVFHTVEIVTGRFAKVILQRRESPRNDPR
jgi:uncharacterized protein YbaR (Trm112 family)